MEKKVTSQAISSSLHSEGCTRYFRHRHSIKFSKNKIDSKVIKSHQYSLEGSHAVLTELNSAF